MNDTLFNVDTQDPEIKSYFEELVGDSKKFKDQEALAKAKYQSDSYINTLTSRMDEIREENDRLREEANSRAALTDVLDQMKQQQKSNSEYTPPANDDKPTITLQDVDSLFSRKFEEVETSRRQQANLQTVQRKLQDTYGNGYVGQLKETAQQLGLSEGFLDTMAKNSPDALFRLLRLDETKQTDVPALRSNQRSDSFAPVVQKRTWSYYQKMKKENPALYHSKQITLQMHRDAQELGDAFTDGDFHTY